MSGRIVVVVEDDALLRCDAVAMLDAAGLAVGFWANLDELRANWQEDSRWEPKMDDAERERQLRNWKKAVTKTLDWVDADTEA